MNIFISVVNVAKHRILSSFTGENCVLQPGGKIGILQYIRQSDGNFRVAVKLFNNFGLFYDYPLDSV